jgi:uncharacterized protein involved in outer membrane biogenesis
MNNSDDVQGFDAPSHTSKKRKVWIGVLGGIVFVVVGASLIIPSLLDQAKYKDLIKTKVAEASGYTVDWEGDIGISIFPLPSASLNNLTVSNGSIQILTLKEADVRVALMPLLSKKLEIASVNLVEPNITLTIDKQGNSTWMTEKLSETSDDVNSGQADAASKESSDPIEVTLDSLKITNGRLLFKNEQAGTQQLVENLTADIKAESLAGPYAAKGKLTYTGKNIEFDAKAGSTDGNTQSYPVQAKIKLPNINVDGEYSGIISASPMKVDGEITVAAKDLGKTIEAFSGSKPSLPDGIGGETLLKAHVVYDGDMALLDSMRLAVGDIAYTGSIGVKDLKSNVPPLAINLIPEKGNTKSSSPLVAALSDLSVKGTGSFANNTVRITSSNIAFRGQNISAAGTYALAKESGQRPVIDFAVKADRLNVDELTGTIEKASNTKSPSASKNKGSASAPTGMSLPFDGKLQADIGTLIQGGKSYSPLKADIVSKGNALTINNLTVGTVADTTLIASGRVGNLSALSDFDLKATVQTADAEALMTAFNLPAPAIKQKIGAATVNGTAKGSLDQVAFNATINALKFAVTGQGSVGTPMTNPVISSLNFNIKHPQLSQALKTFQPDMDAPPSFRGALDLSGNAAWDKNQVNVSDLKGSLGNTSIAGAMNMVTSGDKPSVKGDLSFGDLVFDATKSGGQAGVSTTRAAGTPAPATARWSAEAIDTSWMQSFNADIGIKARSITQDLWKLTNANLSFNLTNGNLEIRNVSAGMFGGQAAMSGQIKSAPLSVQMSMNATDVDARQLQSALTGKVSDTVNGTISAFKVNVTSSGSSPSSLVNGLSGKGDLGGSDIVIKGIDAAQLAETAKGSFKPLERAGSLFQSFQSGQTNFDTMTVAFNIQSGVVTFPTLKLDGPRAMIEGKSGNVNLPNWTIDLTNTITVKGTDIPPFDLTIRGPLDNPLQAGGNVIEDYLRQKATKKIENVIGKELEKRFGIPFGQKEAAPAPAPAVDASAPVSGDAAPAAVEPAAEPAEPASRAATPEEEALKALQGLFGRR